MKPFFMGFTLPGDQKVKVNMNQVCHIMSDGATGSVLTFAAVINNEIGYLVVTESPEEIGARQEWKQ